MAKSCFVCEDGEPTVPVSFPSYGVLSMMAFVVIEKQIGILSRSIRIIGNPRGRRRQKPLDSEIFEAVVSRDVANRAIFKTKDFQEIFSEFFSRCAQGENYVLMIHGAEFERAARDLLTAGTAALDTVNFLEEMAGALSRTYGGHAECFLHWLRSGMERVPPLAECN